MSDQQPSPARPPVGEPRFDISEIRAGEQNEGELQSTDIFIEHGEWTALINIPATACDVTYSVRGGRSGTIHPLAQPPVGEEDDLWNKVDWAALRARSGTIGVHAAINHVQSQVEAALAHTRQQHAEEVEKACAAERAEIALDIRENPNNQWTVDLRQQVASLQAALTEKEQDLERATQDEDHCSAMVQGMLQMLGEPGFTKDFFDADGKWSWTALRLAIERYRDAQRADLLATQQTLARVKLLIDEIEEHCPCGARPESLHTHPHVIGCPVAAAKAALAPAASSSELAHEGYCNPYVARCGAKFCSFEDMAQHQNTCGASSSEEP